MMNRGRSERMRKGYRGQRAAGLVLALMIFGVAVGCGGGGGGEENPPGETPVVTTLAPGQGITIQQVDFDFPGGAQPNSTWGRMVIDPVALGRTGGLKDGYISLVTEQGFPAELQQNPFKSGLTAFDRLTHSGYLSLRPDLAGHLGGVIDADRYARAYWPWASTCA